MTETAGEHVEDEVSRTWIQKALRYALYLYLVLLVAFCIWQYKILFGGWAGIVVGNLIASAIWAPLALIHLDRVAVKHHKERMAQATRHHLESIALQKLHHKQLKAHVSNLVANGTDSEHHE